MENLKQWVESKREELKRRVVLAREALEDFYKKNESSAGSTGYRIGETRRQNQIKRLEKLSYEIMQRYNGLAADQVQLFNDLEYNSRVEVFSDAGIFDKFHSGVSVKFMLPDVNSLSCLISGCNDGCVALCDTIENDIMSDFALCAHHLAVAIEKNARRIYRVKDFKVKVCHHCADPLFGTIKKTANDLAFHDLCVVKIKTGIMNILFGDEHE